MFGTQIVNPFIIFWVAVAVFVVVEVFLVISALRFRAQDASATTPPMQSNARLEFMWTLAPAIILAIIFALTYQKI